jgi:phosphotriesterase-related protein
MLLAEINSSAPPQPSFGISASRSKEGAMRRIQTLRGPIDLDQMGQTMMHEHVFFRTYPDKWHDKIVAFAKKELQELIDAGGQTLVDVGALPQRRIDWYAEIAPQLNLNVIMPTGFYVEWRMPEALRELSENEYVMRFTQELTEGIGDSRIRAGVIKVAGRKVELTPWEIKVMRAAARVQRQTGVPICTHACEGARSQFDTLTKAGADPERIYLSHVEAEFGWEGRSLKEEAQYLLAIAKEGGSLYFNNFALERDTPHEDLMFLMHVLCDKGYAHRVLFGIDANFYADEDGRIYWEDEKTHPETGCRDYAYTYTGAIPLMRRWGFTDKDFHTFLVENPRRMFSTTRI